MTPPILVVAGPTASGKSALAIELAERVGAEIVSADSQQVYRHFDLGTAKPTASELKRVPHHLISVLEPFERCSAGRYRQLAVSAIAEIQARGRRVVVVGGTGLYLRVLLGGVMEAPPVDEGLRARLLKEAEEDPDAAYERLRAIDPETAAGVSPKDRVRVVRALELYEGTGVVPSEQRKRHGFRQAQFDHRLFVLNPPRNELYRRIAERARTMFDSGLVQETRALVERGFGRTWPMRCVGYRQALQVVEGRITESQAVDETTRDTRRYAKRQLTWFRKEAQAVWLEPPFDLNALEGRP